MINELRPRSMTISLANTVDALRDIAATMGSNYWEFDDESCKVLKFGLTPDMPAGAESTVMCQCDFPNDTDCHVVRMYKSLDYICFFCFPSLRVPHRRRKTFHMIHSVLKGFSLPGVLPPQLVKFPYLKEM